MPVCVTILNCSMYCEGIVQIDITYSNINTEHIKKEDTKCYFECI